MTEPMSTAPRSAGALLRAAREKQGLHIAALAAAIKVSPRKLEALEADRIDELPDATFTRALAQTVCRQLKIDARPVLELLPPAAQVELATRPGGLSAPFRERPSRDEPSGTAVAMRPLLWAASALVVAAAALYLVPPGLLSTNRAAPTVVAQPASPAVAVAQPASAAASAPLDVALAASEPAVAASAPMGETVFSAPAAAANEAAAAPAGLVQLRSSEASWVEARDARGQLLLYRTVLPGESIGLDGALPIRMTIGNASSMQLGFRGQPVDLTPRTRDNVARIELQ